MKKTISIIVSAILAFSHIATVPAHAVTPALDPTTINSEGAVLIDADTGQILFSKNPDLQLQPASTTKILTALIIAEDLKLDEVVTIDKDSPFTTGARIYIIEGETFTVEQLLYALLLESANDVAVALAKHHSGTVEQFAKKMNEKAKSLGATHTNFTNPNGLPDAAHLTTAHDMAILGKAFAKQPKLMEIVKTVKYDIPPTNKQPEIRHLFNSNRYLFGTGSKYKIPYKGQTIDIKWDAVTGMKTGYTEAAQNCFVVSATQNGRNLISATLKAQGKSQYIDPRTMLEYGFNNFKPFQFATKGQLIKSVETTTEKKAKIDLYTSADVKALIPLDADEKSITSEIKTNPEIKLPVTEGQVLGQLVLSYQGQVLARTDLITISAINDKATLGKDTTRYIQWLPIDQSPKGLTILGVRILGAFIIWRLILRLLSGKRKKKRKRKPRPSSSQQPNPRRQMPQRPSQPYGYEPNHNPQQAQRPQRSANQMDARYTQDSPRRPRSQGTTTSRQKSR